MVVARTFAAAAVGAAAIVVGTRHGTVGLCRRTVAFRGVSTVAVAAAAAEPSHSDPSGVRREIVGAAE